jgi:hypothetical protein
MGVGPEVNYCRGWLAKNFQMTSLALMSRLTGPTSTRGRYYEPPGQVWPPPSIV